MGDDMSRLQLLNVYQELGARRKAEPSTALQFGQGSATLVGQMLATSDVEAECLLDSPDNGTTAAHDQNEPDEELFVGDDEDEEIDHDIDEDGDMNMVEDDDSSGDRLSPERAKWLNGLAPYIGEMHRRPKPGFPTPCPNLGIEPKEHQYRALAMVEHSKAGPLKSLLVADPLGLGKTLISMMAVVKAIATARRYSIIVAPASCLNQWLDEFERFFAKDMARVLIVRDSTIPPTALLKHDVIIVSYSFVMSQYRKAMNYQAGIAKFKDDGGRMPERPDTSILSEIFLCDKDTKSPYLVSDEVNAIKNPKSVTFRAVRELRISCDTCLVLSGSPIDNT